MRNTARVHALGIVLVALVPASSDAQQRSRPLTMASPPTAPRPSSQPVMRFGSLPQRGADRSSWGMRGFDQLGDRLGHRAGGFTTLSHARLGFLAAPYVAQVAVPYEVPVYVPVPVPVWTRAPVMPSAPAKPYDPTKSKMLTIGAGTDGGGGVMRIERVNDNALRLTWLGSARAVREARLFLADSAQRPLRTSLVDGVTPSALFQIANFEGKIAYTGLTIHFADGATQTTLVPYRANPEP